VDTPQRHKCFLSYNKYDREFVRALGWALMAHGLDVWFDEWEVGAGDSIIDAVDDGLRDCDVFLLVLSEKAAQSTW